MIVADANNSFELTGNGDVLEPESGAIGIGSGGQYALGNIPQLHLLMFSSYHFCTTNYQPAINSRGVSFNGFAIGSRRNCAKINENCWRYMCLYES